MQNNSLINENLINNSPRIKAYRKRWYILFVFVYYAFLNAVQMTEYCSITDVVAKYYNVSHFVVNWTSLLYMVLYPFLMIPASYIIEKKGLRVASLYGCLGTAIGTIIKVFSIGRDRFWIVLFGQVLTASSLVFIMCLPPKIASVWFKQNEISLACSIGTLGPNLGNAFGYLLTVSIVPDNKDFMVVGAHLKILCWVLVIMVVPVTIAVLFYFPEGPVFPPSLSQGKLRQNSQIEKKTSFSVFTNMKLSKGFFIHLVAYATNLGVFSTIMILLSEFVNEYFKDAVEDAGRMGFCMLIFGLVGSLFFGIYLDKTHRYKESCVLIYFMATLSVMMLIVALEKRSMTSAYVFCSIFGIFINPLIPVGFEFGLELTYPSDESTVAGLLFAASQVLSVVFAVTVAHINTYFGSFYALISLASLLTFGTLVEACVPNNLERQRVFKMNRHQTNNYLINDVDKYLECFFF